MVEETNKRSGLGPEDVDLLRRPEAYAAGAAAPVEHLATHISWLFFVGERVYKVKQPVDFGFLDYTTPEARRHFCEEEVRLNRRLAPDTYLGVVPIARLADGSLRVGSIGDEPAPEGQVVDWAVEMLRLPEERMLARLLERGEIDNAMMNELAELVVRFHAGAATGEGVDEHGALAAIRANVEENYAQLLPYRGELGSLTTEGKPAVISLIQHDFLRGRREAFLADEAELLERRVREGHVREGHGDLHAGNLCFKPEGIVAYDCIEFSRRFRCGDVAADLAFLTMDIDLRGFPSFARYLARQYARLALDPELGVVEPFYRGYRAVVRGKVTAFAAAAASDPARRDELARESMRYLQLATAYELQPALVLMCGLPASGKSWLARRLARPLRAICLRSDARRKLLAGLPVGGHAPKGYGEGLYSEESRARTYRALLGDAIEMLEAGHSVVVDATFARRAERARFVDAAERMDLPYYVLHVTASEETTRRRLAERAADPSNISDADFSVYERAKESFEAPEEVPGGHVLELESGDRPPELASGALLDRMIAGP